MSRLPLRPGDAVHAAVISRHTRADVREVECVQVHQLKDEVAVLLHLRHGEDDGLGTQTEGDERVRQECRMARLIRAIQ